MTTPPIVRERFDALDGLRGVAAVGVLLYHLGHWTKVPWLFPHGYLAVDLFFCLSGFVLASAYEQKLKTGMSFRNFTWRRIERLWPLIALGMLLGAVFEVARSVNGDAGAMSLQAIMVALPFGLLMIPTWWIDRPYQLNDPSWSLFFEIAINLIWALSIRWMKLPVILTIVGCATLVLAYLAKANGGLSGGHNIETFGLGAARVFVSYGMGLILYRVYRQSRMKVTLPTPVLALIVLGFLAMPSLSNGAVIYDLLISLAVVPVVVFLGACHAGNLSNIWNVSGRISYPLYVLHQPLWCLFTLVLAGSGVVMSPMISALVVTAILAASWLFLVFYDEPARDWLGKLKPRKSTALA